MSATQSLQAKDRAVQKLQDQVCALEISLASQANLPSVGQSQEEVDLHKEVFDYIPGTVNTRQGSHLSVKGSSFPISKASPGLGTGH